MTSSFIEVNPSFGRIGRFCWANSNVSSDPRRGRLATWGDGEQTLIPDGWWGSFYWCIPHPATPTNAW